MSSRDGGGVVNRPPSSPTKAARSVNPPPGYVEDRSGAEGASVRTAPEHAANVLAAFLQEEQAARVNGHRTRPNE
jgi:hypothetical protein